MRILAAVDECTRASVSSLRRGAPAEAGDDVLARCVAQLFVERGPPTYLRSDNGPGVHRHGGARLAAPGGRHDSLHRARDSPWRVDGYVESFNGKLRDECLQRGSASTPCS